MRKTKIVCTLGPATDREGVLRQMLQAGMNVARFNFSHGSHAEHKGRLDALKALRAELGLPVAAMLDTKGPEVRLKSFAAGSVMLRTGQEFTLTTRDIVGDEQGCSITYADLPGGIQLRSDVDYSFRNGTNITPGEDDQVVWNASLSWRFLKQKKAELSFYWADILSQKKNFTRSVSSSGLSERHTQQIGSWFMLSFKYRFNKQL